MKEVNLRETDLRGAYLFEVIMMDVNLMNACLKGADTEDVFFSRCKDVTFDNTMMPDGNIFTDRISSF